MQATPSQVDRYFKRSNLMDPLCGRGRARVCGEREGKGEGDGETSRRGGRFVDRECEEEEGVPDVKEVKATHLLKSWFQEYAKGPRLAHHHRVLHNLPSTSIHRQSILKQMPSICA